MAKYNKKSLRRRRRNSMKGGDASQHAISVYGSAMNQHPLGMLPNGGTSNMIAANPQSGGNLQPLQPTDYNQPSLMSDQGTNVMDANSAGGATDIISGGKRGGNVLGEIAVPAGLLIANEFAKNRSSRYSKTKKSNGKKKLFSRSSNRRNRR